MAPIIEMRNIVKMYANGVVANKGINFSVERGEIHALVGENGAGKSTLMKILYGLEQPTEGELLLDGKTVEFKSPHEAIAKGNWYGASEFHARAFLYCCGERCFGG